MFQNIYTHKIGLPLHFQHWQLLETLTYDNFGLVAKQCLPHLLLNRSGLDGNEFLLLGLEWCKYVLDPASGFRQRYFELLPKDPTFDETLQEVRNQCTQTLIELATKCPHLKTPFIQANLNAFRSPPQVQEQAGAWLCIESPRTSY
jgi:hypothetical protein